MKLRTTALTLLAAALAAPALAYEAGDIIVRAGAANVRPDTTDNTAVGTLDVKDNTQLGLTATWMATPNVGVQLLAATPFKHDITAGGNTIGDTRHLPPTLTVQWYPLAGSKMQPYVGAGLNYTLFFDDNSSLGDLKLTNSTGLALEAGVDVVLSDTLVLNAAVWKLDINTDVKLNGTNLGELEIDPLAFMIGVGYRF